MNHNRLTGAPPQLKTPKLDLPTTENFPEVQGNKVVRLGKSKPYNPWKYIPINILRIVLYGTIFFGPLLVAILDPNSIGFSGFIYIVLGLALQFIDSKYKYARNLSFHAQAYTILFYVFKAPGALRRDLKLLWRKYTNRDKSRSGNCNLEVDFKVKALDYDSDEISDRLSIVEAENMKTKEFNYLQRTYTIFHWIGAFLVLLEILL